MSRGRLIVVVIVCLLLGLGAGWLYYDKTPPVYQSTASVLVLPTSTGLDPSNPGASPEISMETEAELARSSIVIASAAERSDGQVTASQLQSSGEVTVPQNSQVLQFTVSAGTAQAASDGANDWAEAYLIRRTEKAASRVDDATKALLTSYQEAQADLRAITGNTEVDKAARDVQKAKIDSINKQLVALGIIPGESGEVISSAPVPAKPASPQLTFSLAAGLLLGGALAGGLVFLLSRRRSAKAAEAAAADEIQAPVLAILSGDTSDLAKLRETCREVVETSADPGPVTLVGSMGPAPTANVALHVGRAWAAEVGRCVVVAPDETAGRALPVATQGRPGLLDLLARDAEPSGCASPLTGSSALVIGSGDARHALAAKEFSAQALVRVWSDLANEFGTVVVSTSSHSGALGSTAIRTAGPVVGVISVDRGREAELAALRGALKDHGASDRLVGVIVVDSGYPLNASPADPSPSPQPGTDTPSSTDDGSTTDGALDRGDDPSPSWGDGDTTSHVVERL